MSAYRNHEASSGGEVSAGFEPVKDVFTAHLKELGDGGGAFCAYIEGHQVVDIWGGRATRIAPWHKDTCAVLMSSTKGLVTMCAQILVDRGQLDVEMPVAKYWPEFAQAGKENILVRHVLTHTSGVIGFGSHRPVLEWDGTGWGDGDAIARGLAASEPLWPPGAQLGYHALTYGWLIGEVIRRITGRTVGAFFETEVAKPLSLDLHIGTPLDDQARVAPIINHLMTGVPLAMRFVLRRAMRDMADPGTLAGNAFVADGSGNFFDHAEELFGREIVLEMEIPAANGTGSARSLARLYAMLSQGGELDGVRIVSSDAVRMFAAEQISLPDVLTVSLIPRWLRWYLTKPARRTLGYLINPALPGGVHTFGPNVNAYGHDGSGGQVAFCDTEKRIAVGFVRNDLGVSPRFSNRLIASLYQCAGLSSTSRSR
jgi:CubicO group peptidase (beta-lactamase class C family)